MKEQKRFPVVGMRCAGCAHSVEQAASKVEGISDANVQLAENILSVSVDERLASAEDLRKAIRSIGFDLIVEDSEAEQLRRRDAMEAAELMKITSHELLEMSVVDKVISEAGLSSKELIKSVKKELQAELAMLSQKPLEELLEERYQRFRKY